MVLSPASSAEEEAEESLVEAEERVVEVEEGAMDERVVVELCDQSISRPKLTDPAFGVPTWPTRCS